MVDVVQLVRASDCGSECRGFESHLPPSNKASGNPVNKGFPLIFYTLTITLSTLQVAFKRYKWSKQID